MEGYFDMNLVTTTGYGSTGSSVITDLLKEFKSVNSLGDFEFTFLSTVNGMRDLEYGLFELNSRSNVDVYIKNYIKEVDYLSKPGHSNYERWFNGKFRKFSLEFIQSIVDVEWDGYNLREIRDENLMAKMLYYAERFYQKKILRLPVSSATFYTKIMQKKRYYACPSSREAFYEKVRNYTGALAGEISTEPDQSFIAFDQLVPATDITHYLNYFDNLKVIVVDRDPRDLYLLEKHEYKEMFIPYDNVETFVRWYKMIRECKPQEKHPNILRLQFEDFIYHYDETVEKIIHFLGLDRKDWKEQRRYFDPDISIRNTNKTKVCTSKEDVKVAEYIEKNLQSYCYMFE